MLYLCFFEIKNFIIETIVIQTVHAGKPNHEDSAIWYHLLHSNHKLRLASFIE